MTQPSLVDWTLYLFIIFKYSSRLSSHLVHGGGTIHLHPQSLHGGSEVTRCFQDNKRGTWISDIH